MGVITGVVMSYEIGTNWAGFSRAVGNVLGPLFMYEAAMAFFLESGFVGIMLFAEGRISRGLHLFACIMVALGSLMSASWILAANSWMETPAGAVADADGILRGRLCSLVCRYAVAQAAQHSRLAVGLEERGQLV